eukprot:1398831-Karenia_brevis.AAC.1
MQQGGMEQKGKAGSRRGDPAFHTRGRKAAEGKEQRGRLGAGLGTLLLIQEVGKAAEGREQRWKGINIIIKTSSLR